MEPIQELVEIICLNQTTIACMMVHQTTHATQKALQNIVESPNSMYLQVVGLGCKVHSRFEGSRECTRLTFFVPSGYLRFEI